MEEEESSVEGKIAEWEKPQLLSGQKSPQGKYFSFHLNFNLTF